MDAVMSDMNMDMALARFLRIPMEMHIASRGSDPSASGPGGRPQILDLLADLRRTMEALDEARVRVAGILNLPDTGSPTPGSRGHTHMMPFYGYHDFMDMPDISKIRRKNRTVLDDAILKCLIS